MSTWTERVKLRMQELMLTQENLAIKLGITRAAVTHYLSGRRVPPLQKFHKLATVLKCDPAWLQYGIDNETSTIKKVLVFKEKSEVKHHSIPILSWNQASARFGVKQIKHEETNDYIQHIFTDQAHWFALRVKGDSMIANSGHSKSFHDGDIIIIDPNKEANHGDFVIALLPKAKEITFKQYVTDSGKQYLKPLNPQYPIIPIDEGTLICGIVIKSFK